MSTSRLTVGVIGASGALGSWLSRCCEEMGYAVIGSDVGTSKSNVDVVHEADVVFVCTHISQVPKVAAEIHDHLSSSQLVVLCTSGLVIPFSYFDKTSASICGLHLLSAPSEKTSFAGLLFAISWQKVILIKFREWLRHFVVQGGGVLIGELSPEEHDFDGAIVQQPIQMALLAVAKMMQNRGESFARESGFETLFFKMVRPLIARASKQRRVYAEIAVGNPFAAQLLAELAGVMQQFATLAARGDLEGLLAAFPEPVSEEGWVNETKFVVSAHFEGKAK